MAPAIRVMAPRLFGELDGGVELGGVRETLAG